MMNTDKKTSCRSRLAAGALGLLAVAAVALPATAFAQQGYTSKFVKLRAGPSRDYPIVVNIPAGVALNVVACLPDYRWCDVVVGANRGWLHGGSINYTYQGRNVPVQTYGSAIGIGVTTFILGSYWDDYYRNYSWYPQRQRWIDRSPQYYGYPPRAEVRPYAPRPPQDNYTRPAPRPPAIERPTTRPTPAPAAPAPTRGPSGDPGDKRTSRDLTQGAER
jgi:uncharacterized protein YraI